jgi:Zn-dependent protease/predicted transcriptional regulator
MFGNGIPIARIGGIQIKIDVSWFLIALLVAWSLAVVYFPDAAPGYSTGAYWAAGIVVSLLFFASLLLHELAHSLVARARGLRVVGITLYLFGGVSEIGSEVTNPDDEFRIAAAGPLTSFALAAVFGFLWAFVGDQSDLVAASLGYLALINLMLAIFNLLPGLPLDGGRLLQAVVWRLTGDEARATRVASRAGVVLGYVLIAIGLVSTVFGGFVNGLWLVFLGWYLQNLARQEQRATQTRALLKGMRVADLTDTHPYTVAPGTTLDQVVDQVMLPYQAQAVAVVADGRFRGLLTTASVQRVRREQWPVTTAAAAMIPADQVAAATPNEPAETAIADMQERDLDQVPVVQDGTFVGLLSRAAILRQLGTRTRLTTSQ